MGDEALSEEDEVTGPDPAAAAMAAGYASFKVVEIVDVSVPLPSIHAVVHLSEAAAPFRSLNFPIGLAEGAALVSAIERSDGSRPMTHELFSEVLRRVNIDVVAMRIVDRVEGVLHAEIDLMGSRGREVLQCRPSDGLILCQRQSVPAPILVDEEIFDAD